jgi:type I restriction enzyme S subunit
MVPKGWRSVCLEDIAAKDYGMVDGPFGSNLPASLYVPDGIPIIRGGNLSLGEERFNDDKFVFVSEITYKQLERSSCRPGDIVFTKKGTLGQTGIVPNDIGYDKFLISSNQMKLTVALDVADPLYVYYFVSSPESRDRIIRESTASGVPKTNLTYLRRFPIVIPPLPEQKAIARILGALDDKIELNRRMNHTLEEMARALFKSWFVDFEPITAKAEGRVPFGMNAETAALFPTEFEETGEGEIPKGWRMGTVGEAFDLIMGQSPPGETYNEIGEGISFYQGRTDFGNRYPTPRIYCTAPTRFANSGDTLVSVRAPVGDVNMANEKCSIGRGLASIRHKSGSRSFTYYSMLFMKEDFDVFEGEGTLFGSISGDGFRNIKVIIPSQEVVAEFERQAHSLDQSIENNESQIKTLATIRDALLPKLLSGELRVKA